MKRISALRYTSIGLATLGFAGFAAASTVSYGTTGPYSNNTATLNSTNTSRVDNDNNLTVSNSKNQHASSGTANASTNTTSGSVTSGDASNSADSSTDVSVSNSSGFGGAGFFASPANDNISYDITGPYSNQNVTINRTNRMTVDNDNTVKVTNRVYQTATTGSANANNNTTVGDVTSGDASNTSTTDTTVSVSN